ncbi:MAG TPA: hypothetical protein VNV44_13270 [Solirubrobacteraceae bacterium]|nr:hypothetical protein [Solirubrobacteraceae bacterium]
MRAPAASDPAQARALAYARAVNLRPGDVPGAIAGEVQEPGFVVGPGHEGPVREGPFDAWIERCDGGVSIARSRLLAGYSSLHLTRGLQATQAGAPIEGVRSVVFLFGTRAAARRELSVLSSARARACLERDGDATGGAGSETGLEVSRIRTPSGVYGVAWSATPRSYRPPARRYRDLLAFTAGRMLVVLHATAEPRPFQAGLEARLLGLLRSRAEAQHS